MFWEQKHRDYALNFKKKNEKMQIQWNNVELWSHILLQ